jgi:hypothetical protein
VDIESKSEFGAATSIGVDTLSDPGETGRPAIPYSNMRYFFGRQRLRSLENPHYFLKFCVRITNPVRRTTLATPTESSGNWRNLRK